MGFPLALKNFLTLKIRPERSEGRKFLNFGLSCLHKNCSKFFQILAILDLYFGSKKQVLPKQKTSSYTSWENLQKFFYVENFWFRPILGGRRGIRFWASIDPLGSISGEDKGGMGFPLALKDFLTLKFCPERSEGQKILNFGFCCLNKSCSNFVHILAQKKASFT